MIPHVKRPWLPVAIGVGILIGGIGVAGYALTGSIGLTDRNCERIELLKRVQRDALVEQMASSEKFLVEHPKGIPGIPPALILEGINRDRRTIARLASETC